MIRRPRNRARAIALAHPSPLTLVRAWLVAGAAVAAVAQLVLSAG